VVREDIVGLESRKQICLIYFKYTYITISMKEVTLDVINKNVKSLLIRVEKDMNVGEHQTGAFGQVKMKPKKKPKLMPQDISEEQRLNKTFQIVRAMQKIDVADAEVNGGFGTTPDDDDEDDDDEDFLMPKEISNENKGFVQDVPDFSKASYEYIASDTSYTDESNPSDDVFYVPSNIKLENGDTDSTAKKKEKKRKDLEETTFGNIDENISDSGAARPKQQLNTGAVENAQIGGQGI
jgi:hypothetical protein